MIHIHINPTDSCQLGADRTWPEGKTSTLPKLVPLSADAGKERVDGGRMAIP
jgi:hypothetical protein